MSFWLILIWSIIFGAITACAYKSGYAEARKKYEDDNALDSYYNGINQGYFRGYNDGAHEYFNLEGKANHARVSKR